ncbi:phosphoribosylformylglycinamidine synthase subunit PurL [Saccharicrinis aurantiacus]|uniref:phosphoribosylformylglycinamidine synthase subunit PurL n=1 Tax=Saccharicrinis aurantiacus TaxID=1849719 RepID=UPI000838BE3A|nr:phosphoribosylformylglycinamidine synthase subunit PurL [Saccharicrinis aurantiacus]
MGQENIASEINLTATEQDLIFEILKREPNSLELEMFSRLWSEHASYKNSMKWLQMMPTSGDKVVVKAGDEKAGAIDIGDGYACVFKMESHNHPCSFQPRLGALTGMRVVTRDVFAMGAKPVALLDSLRFGEANRDTARWLFNEVIGGISEFEKTMRLPVVGGEVVFNKAFNSSPIVNNMAIGIAKKDELISGTASGLGNLILIVGALTGNEGIDGDTFSADYISNTEQDSFGIEQMLDSTVEGNLINAIKELKEEGKVIGIQTIGAAGIAGAATEMASRGNVGITINCDKVPTRNENMGCRDVLFSETWGRILVCIDKDNLAQIQGLLSPKQLSFAVVGEVVKGENLICLNNNDVVADIPTSYVGLGGKSPIYEREVKEPESNNIKALNIEDIPEPEDYQKVIAEMLKNINLSSKESLMDLFDPSLQHESFNNSFPSDAAYVHIEEIDKTLAISIDSNSNYLEADPFVGAQIAVAEAARNIICGGGVPLAVTDCLNFGNPYDPEVFWQFTKSVEGLSDACEKFNTPIVSGNVSFYNQKSVEGRITAITPSPIVGMLGLVESKDHHSVLPFKHKGDVICLIGESKDDINASEYLIYYHKQKSHAAPYFNMEEELELHEIVKQVIRKRLVRSVHDVSAGGLFFNLLESAAPLGFGFDITSDAEIRKDSFLFGESQGRVVVSVAPSLQDDFVDFMLETETKFSVLGHVTKGEVRIDDESFGFIDDIKSEYSNSFKDWMNNEDV